MVNDSRLDDWEPTRSGALPRVASWWMRERAETMVRYPRLWPRLACLWVHPAVLLLILAVVVPGSLGGVIHGGDADLFRNAGDSMLGPRFFDVFSNRGLQIGPVYLLALGVVSKLVAAAGLPTAFVLAALQAAGVTWLALVTAKRLARRSGADEYAAQWAVGVPMVLGGLLAEAAGNGHPEEILLGLLLANAAIGASENRRFVPGLLVGLATGTKLWGVLGAPLLLVGRRPANIARRCLVAAAVVTFCYGPFFAFGDVSTFTFQWGMTSVPLVALIAPWLHGTGWSLRVVQGVVAGIAGSFVALRRRGSPLPVVIVVIAVRLLLDPVRQLYYSGPLVVVMLLWLWTTPSIVGIAWKVGFAAAVPAIILVPYLAPRALVDAVSTVLYIVVPLWVLWRDRSAALDRSGQGQAVTS